MIKHLYIFRHGETDYNAAGKLQGQTLNVGLNANGRRQAETLAADLQDRGLEYIISSSLKRAAETAQIVANKLHLPVKEDNHFIEGNFGEVEGKTKTELSIEQWQTFDDWIKLDKQFLDVHFKGGESKRQIMNRAVAGLQAAVKLPYNHIGISTHSAVLRMVLLYLGKKQNHIDNAKAFHIIYKDGKFKLADHEKILLLSCCAPCSCAVIKTMAEQGTDFAVAFYNPNIRPYSEYEKRRDENLRVCQIYGVPFIELEYDNDRWCQEIKGLENEPERGKRCSLCFKMRIARTMEYARQNGFTAVASVLGVSRYKNLNQVNAAADLAVREAHCPYVEIEGRKNGMQELRAELIKELNLYNQDYCGCTPRK